MLGNAHPPFTNLITRLKTVEMVDSPKLGFVTDHTDTFTLKVINAKKHIKGKHTYYVNITTIDAYIET